ncbi:MAG: hypothetical protein KDC10_13625, partial [Calditrichaeota bacterium]|nr:hypothetical protein [Calditrichota bacterium]
YDWYWYVDDMCISGGGGGGALDAPVVAASYTLVGNQVTLSWDPVAGADSYDIYSATAGYGPWSFLSNTAGTTYNTNAVSGGHYYEVVAKTAALTASSVPVSVDPYRNRVYLDLPGKTPAPLSSTVKRTLSNGVVSDTYLK